MRTWKSSWNWNNSSVLTSRIIFLITGKRSSHSSRESRHSMLSIWKVTHVLEKYLVIVRVWLPPYWILTTLMTGQFTIMSAQLLRLSERVVKKEKQNVNKKCRTKRQLKNPISAHSARNITKRAKNSERICSKRCWARSKMKRPNLSKREMSSKRSTKQWTPITKWNHTSWARFRKSTKILRLSSISNWKSTVRRFQKHHMASILNKRRWSINNTNWRSNAKTKE